MITSRCTAATGHQAKDQGVTVKKLFPIALMAVGLVFLGAGVYTAGRGFDAKDRVHDELVAQNITTPEDARIPNVQVKDAKTAQVMADIIDHHASEATGGLTYAEMGRFATEDFDPAGTNVEAEAVTDAQGKPVPNPLRNTAFQASALRTSLLSSVMAENVATLVVGLGAMIATLGLVVGGLGVALAGLAIPSFSKKVHVEPVAAA
jgi:hypothetical protein